MTLNQRQKKVSQLYNAALNLYTRTHDYRQGVAFGDHNRELVAEADQHAVALCRCLDKLNTNLMAQQSVQLELKLKKFVNS